LLLSSNKKIVTCEIDFLEKKKLSVRKSSLGGYERRSASLDLSSGLVTYTVGDGSQKELK